VLDHQARGPVCTGPRLADGRAARPGLRVGWLGPVAPL